MKYTELTPTEIKQKADVLFDSIAGLNTMAAARVYLKEAVALIFVLADQLEYQGKMDKLRKKEKT